MGSDSHRPAEPDSSAAEQEQLEQRIAALGAELCVLRARLHALRGAHNGVEGTNGHRAEASSNDPAADRIRALVEADRVEAARRLVEQFMRTSPTARIQHWAHVLAPPVVRVAKEATGHSVARNNAWLREHSREYAGKWVALRNGVLLGADEDRIALHRRLEQRGELEGSAFAYLWSAEGPASPPHLTP
jgi:hypothetical protein